MKKIICISIVILITLFSLPLLATSNKHPNEAFMGLREGEIASIDLESWEVTYYDTHSLEERHAVLTHDINYFSSVDKIVFVAGSNHHRIGVIDLTTEEVIYPWPDDKDLLMINYSLNIKESNVVYFQFAEKPWSDVSEEKVEQFRDGIKLFRYNIAEDDWREIESDGFDDMTTYLRDRIPDGPSGNRYAEDELMEKLINQEILENDTEEQILGEVYLDQEYFLARKENEIILVKVLDEDEFEVIKRSPEDFGVNYPELIDPDSLVIKIDD